tara:strand:+ start:21605 stop:21772 length:168 start_codon:yes stop_codon:yes gene_type:complete
LGEISNNLQTPWDATEALRVFLYLAYADLEGMLIKAVVDAQRKRDSDLDTVVELI